MILTEYSESHALLKGFTEMLPTSSSDVFLSVWFK